MRFWLAGFAAALLTCAPSLAADNAHAIHERLLTLDTHLDTPANFPRAGWSILDRHSVKTDLSQVDLPRMKEGGLDGGFFAIFTPQGPRTPEGNAAARDAGLLRGLEIREMVAAHPSQFELALTAADAAKIAAKGKRIVYMSIENSYPIGDDLTLMETFYKLGVRMIGPVHFLNNDLGDSSTDPKGAEWHGLSPLGKKFVAEANRLGMILDASHASDDVLDQMLDLSDAPIILSHSGSKAIFDHPRNVDDARIERLAAKGGVIQVNSYGEYVARIEPNAERDAATRALGAKYGNPRQLPPDRFKAYMEERSAIDARYPQKRPTFDDFMAHLDHVLKLVGPEHVGIGLDWDGGGGVTGMEDVSQIPKITERLLKEGYSEQDLQKIWSGNVLRVLAAAENKAQH